MAATLFANAAHAGTPAVYPEIVATFAFLPQWRRPRWRPNIPARRATRTDPIEALRVD